jgi:hypothetical protein
VFSSKTKEEIKTFSNKLKPKEYVTQDHPCKKKRQKKFLRGEENNIGQKLRSI